MTTLPTTPIREEGDETGTPTPWAYRPWRHDDWGIVRAANGTLVCRARNGMFSEAQFNEHRKNGTDPFGEVAKQIIEAVNSHSTLTTENARLKSDIAELHWMARRYADGRMTYAVGRLNEITRRLLAGNIIKPASEQPDKTVWARDGRNARDCDGLTPEEAALGDEWINKNHEYIVSQSERAASEENARLAERVRVLEGALENARTYVELIYQDEGGEEAAEAKRDLSLIDRALQCRGTER